MLFFITRLLRAAYARACQIFWRYFTFFLRACTGGSNCAPPTEHAKIQKQWKTNGKQWKQLTSKSYQYKNKRKSIKVNEIRRMQAWKKHWKNQAKAMKTIEKAKPKQWNHWFHWLFPYAPAAAEVIGTFSYAHITRDLRRACLAQKTLLNGH